MTGILNLQLNSGAVTFACVATAISIGALITAKWQQRPKKKKTPTKWRRVGEISELFIYPLKSGQSVKVNALECTELGVKTTDDNPLKLRDRLMRSETVEVLDCGNEAAKWMSKYLLQSETGARMGYYIHDVLERRTFSKLPYSEFRNYYNNMELNDAGIYSDIAPFMLITESSVQELHSRVSSTVSKLTPLQFRPNFVVRGSKPFDEDNWDWVRIGDVLFRNIKPCTRCIMTTIDPETGIKHKEMEPLKTLKSYRQVTGPARKVEGDAPCLGVFLASRTTGIVCTGDPIYVGA